MKTLHRPGEINYYEELGVQADASPEEIRDAFRALARLLHPDQQTDEQLKEIAERQMRKLNPIYSVLSDPERRRRYDEDLEDGYPPSIIVNNALPPDLHRIGGRLAWVAAIALSAVLLIWLASGNMQGPQSRPRFSETAAEPLPPPKTPSSPTEAAFQIAELRSNLKAVLAERDAALRELDTLHGKPVVLNAPGTDSVHVADRPASIATMTELPSPPRLSAMPVAAKNESSTLDLSRTDPSRIESARAEASLPNRRLTGFWFYVKPPDGQKNKNQSLYPPEYIEASITEENGVLHGRYRSRFRIVDRAISPDVDFSFSAPTSPSISCQWIGAAGAKGDLTLRLLTENSIRIDWKASDLGSQQGLISGTAVLTRKIE